jgi:hypothetical protein
MGIRHTATAQSANAGTSLLVLQAAVTPHGELSVHPARSKVKRGKHQFELPAAGIGSVFNLSSERGDDPFRVERERWEQSERHREAREYAAKMQMQLEQCPGFIGADAPESDTGRGRIVIDPVRVTEAHAWLKRRFHTSENLELSDNGLCIELKPRVRSKSVCANRGKRLPVSFERPTQFELGLNTETEIV